MKTKKIKIMASFDWSLLYTIGEFVKFLNPVIAYKGEQFKIELGRVIARPIKCGTDLSEEADFVIDRTVHWNEYYKCWAQQALNCKMRIVNHTNTFQTFDKHSTYDLMARAMHPQDRLPTTVLLPQFHPYNKDQEKDALWKEEQEAIIKNTSLGFDKERRHVDMPKVQEHMEMTRSFFEKGKIMRNNFYCSGNYLQEAMEEFFDNKFPVYLKQAFGGGGVDVYKINSMEELYKQYDRTGERAFHLQEAIEDYDVFVRCMALGPQILPMKYQPDTPLHQHYSPEKLKMDKDIYTRLANYVMLINAYHRWTYNSYEALVKDGSILPIDFANACPDSHFTSLHVHFPWVICALLKWITYCAVTEKDMRIDLETERYLSVLNDPERSASEKYEYCAKLSRDYFEIEDFENFCQENFSDLDERMIEFYDRRVDDIIQHAISFSDFPPKEHEKFFSYYKDMMEKYFRANAREYLTTVLFSG